MYRIITKENEKEASLMDAFAARHANGHFLQSPRWAAVKEKWQWRGVLSYDLGGRLRGAASVLIRPLPLGLSLLYVPRGPVCDRADARVLRELLEGIGQVARTVRAPLLLLDPDVPDEDERFRAAMTEAGFLEHTSEGLGNIQAQYVFRLDLAGRTEDEVFAAFSQKTRYNIRVARRHGVELRTWTGGDTIPDEAFDAFSRLMEATGERDRFLVRDKGYFRRVMAALGKNAVLFLAFLDGEPIAGTIGVYYDRKAWYLYGASGNQHREAMPNYLLQWEMIRRALRAGCAFYDLRGVPGDPAQDGPLYGLYRFKRGFSGRFTKFSGLYIKKYAPLTGGLLLALMRLYRRFQCRRLQRRPRLVWERAARERKELSRAG